MSVDNRREILNSLYKLLIIQLTLDQVRRPYNYIDPPILDKLEQMTEQLRTAGRICNVINIHNFIELPGEEVGDSTKDLIEHVAELYAEPNRDAEIDEDESEQP